MTYRSKISKTKKRLSDDRWAISTVIVGLFGLFAIVTFGLRVVNLSWVYGVVPAEIPVATAAIQDPGAFNFKEEPRDVMTPQTPAVFLTTEAFFFGDMSAFSTNFADPRGKFMIKHVDGEPQLQTLVQTMSDWVLNRTKDENVPINKVLVFVPAGDIPMPIVIQVLAGLRKSPQFSRVILGSGLM